MSLTRDFVVKEGLQVQGTTQSALTSSGALLVAGGAGIGGNINIGGSLNVQALSLAVHLQQVPN
jgi:hypothetical protein